METPSIRVKHSIYQPSCQVHHHGLVFTRVNRGARRVRGPEASPRRFKIAAVFRAVGLMVQIDGEYPGWSPNPGSPLLARCQQVFRQTFGTESTVQVIHTGLECGIIGANYPGLDTVSVGPAICGAQAPGERVEVASVARCWTLLRSVL